MIQYKQTIPEFVDYDPADLEEGKVDKLIDLFKKDFVKRHVEFCNSSILRFRRSTNNADAQVNSEAYLIFVEYPEQPAMTHQIGKVIIEREILEESMPVLLTPHPLLMQKVYNYLATKPIKRKS